MDTLKMDGGMQMMKRLDWLTLWDEFRKSIEQGKNSWGKNEILNHMAEMERKMVRKLEKELE